MINSLKTLVSSANIPFISGGGNSHVSNHLQHRPRMATVALLLLTFSFFNITSARAEKLCQSNYTGTIGALGSKTVQVSVGTIGTNMYRVVFESDFTMTGSETYVNTSVNDNLCLDNTTKTILDGGKRIFFDMPSTSAPVFKNAIQVKTSAENFTLTGTDVKSVDWTQTTAECSALVGNDCSGRSTEKSEGNDFTNGYEYDFSSDGSGNVNISVTFLDTPDGMVNPQLYTLNSAGGEIGPNPSMTWNSSTHTASHTLTGQTGTIYFKVRVPYSGGVFVTKKFTIKVGEPCDAVGGCDEPLCGEPDETTIWFLNTNTWADNFTYAYMWKGATNNGPYPGVVMTQTDIVNKDGKRLYSITFDKDQYVNVKFNCNSNNNGCYTGDLSIEPFQCYNFKSGWVNRPCSVVVATDANSYSTSADPMAFQCNSLDYTARVTFTAGNHAFKIVATDNGTNYWYGCTPGTTPTASFSNYAFSTSGGNMPFTADVPGEYYFAFNYATQTVSVTYPPYMTSASLDTKTSTTAIINVTSTRGTKYRVVDAAKGFDGVFVPSDGKITVTGLSQGTRYNFTITALDANETESSNNVVLGEFITLISIVPAADPSLDECQVAGMFGLASFGNAGLRGDCSGETESYGGKDVRHIYGNGTLGINDMSAATTSSCDHIHFEVWASESFTFTAKLRGYLGEWQYSDPKNLTTTAGGWQLFDIALSDFANNANCFSNVFSGFDFSNMTGKDMWVANVYLYAESNACAADATTAPTAPTKDQCQVHSIYSKNYLDVGMSFGEWGSGSTQTEETIDGTPMYKVHVNNSYFGLPINGKIDATAYQYIHMDVWTPIASTFSLKPICWNYSTNGNETEYGVTVSTTAATWTSVDVPISNFTDLGLSMKSVYQLKFDAVTAGTMFVTNIYFYNTASCPSYTPKAGTYHFGTAQRQNVELYVNEGHKANTANILAQRFDYYIVDCGEQLLTKVVTNGKFATGAYSQMLLTWNDAKNGHQENYVALRNAAATESYVRIGQNPAQQYHWNGQTNIVPMNYYLEYQNQNIGSGISDFFDYRRGYINNPNGDETNPTLTSAAKTEETDWFTLTFTGGNDNSGQWFYYIEDDDLGYYKVSLEDTIRIPKTGDGIVLNLKCYTVDFNGNMSLPQNVKIEMPFSTSSNLALKKPVVMGVNSNAYVSGQNYTESNDGSYITRWGGGDHGTSGIVNYTNEWWYVDLLGYYSLKEIKIWFENAYTNNFVLQACETLPDNISDDTKWRTIYTNTTNPNTGQNSENVNTYDVQGNVGRYIRIKSYHNVDAQWGFSMWEFEVYGTAMVAKDATAPTVTTAEVSAIVENNKLQLTLVADDGSKEFRITDSEGNVYVKTADESNHVVMDNITYTYCTNYTFSVQAMDDAANLSEVVGCSGSVAPAVDFDLMDIPEGGVTASASVSAGDGWAAGKAIDSDDNTYWATGANFGEQWLAVDLTRIFGISSIKVAWNNANVSNLYIEGSRDGSNYYVLKHVTTAPATYSSANAAIAYETYTLESHIQVRHIRLRAVGLNAEMAVRDIQIFGSCADNYDRPVMTEGVLKDVTINASLATATVTVNAYDETTQPASLTYKAVFSTGGLEDRTGLTVTDGMITLTGLTVGTSYTVRIYAVDESGNVSENYKEVSFTPYINLYYFTSDGTGVSGVWAAVITNPESAAKRRFEATEHSGIYYYQIKAPAEGDVHYRLYYDESGAQVSEVANYWSGSDHQLVSGHNGETIEVFAKDKDHFVSIFDELKVYGSAVFADTEGSAFTMAYAGNHKFVWQGRVQAGTFRIIVNNNHSGLTDNSRVRIMNDDSFENSSDWTHAKLTFDMEAWTWSWEEIDSEEFCEYSGGEGSGIVGLNGSRALTGSETYKLFAYMSGNNWVVEIAFPTGAGKVYLQPFNAASGTDRTQFEMPPLGGNLYSVSLTPEQIATLYTADGIVRYTVKIEVAGGSDICQTEIHYFDLSNGVCAPDYFDIYHWDDASEGKRTSYNGGIIMQPIRYFRHFEHTDWCAIAFPFEVSRVAVYDNDDRREYDLYPRFYNGTKDVEGYYWLKTFPDWDNTPVSIANFKGTWQQLTYNTEKTGATPEEEADLATHVLPSKNVPYVISFTDGSYYGTNWVIFYGEGGQTIASEADGQCENSITGSEEVVKLQRNNMMKPTETKSNIYMLEEGYDIYARYTQPIPAFESYVVGTSSVQTKYRIIRLRGETTPDTGTTTGLGDVPTTAGWKGDIYSVSGAKVATFASRDTMEHYLESLSPGIYVIRTASQILKIVVP